ncbi:hypothetical protein NEOLEDRAFT_205390 [Neolentinus lepideus HHB14362 ss-1]|uniref:Uncharacterized protein n=1 Tax=Neolentinus lepideus HHB14362 ss-1 TaxID=1314782 RepID=A0A165TJ33_9AGAM|nr:hypothetical protein NEOLEDRAFT_205390 [Neolentinus lepideus HHB14362 ss-1]
MTIQGVFAIMGRGHGASTPKTPPTPHSTPCANNVPEPTRMVDPVLLQNFLAETHQVEGCTCDICAMRDEQARLLVNTTEDAYTTNVTNTHLTNDTRPRDIRTSAEVGPRRVTSPGGNSSMPDLSTIREEPAATSAAGPSPQVQNVTDVLHFLSPEGPRSRSLSGSRSRTDADYQDSRSHRLGLGILRCRREPRNRSDLSAALNEIPGSSSCQPARHVDIIPTLLVSEPTIVSLNSPPLASPASLEGHHIHSPDPQAYVHQGRRHPNFNDTSHAAPSPSQSCDFPMLSPCPRQERLNQDGQPRYTNSLRVPNQHRQLPNPRAYGQRIEQPLPPVPMDLDNLPLATPPQYTRRDYRRAPLYLRRNMDAYFSIDTAAIEEELPAYSTHDPLLVQALRGRRHRERPYIEGFQEAELARHHDDHDRGRAGPNSNANGESGREGGQQGLGRFMTSLMRSTVRFCSFMDPMRHTAPVERGYGTRNSDRVPMEVLRRELARQEAMQNGLP